MAKGSLAFNYWSSRFPALETTGLVCECTKERRLAALLSKPRHLLVSKGSAELPFRTQKDLVLVMTKADVQECPQPDTALAVPDQDLGAVLERG